MNETQSTLTELESRVQSPVQWRFFLRGLAEEIDSTAGTAARNDLLRRVGRLMAGLLPLPPTRTLDALEFEMNDVLTNIGWGSVRLVFDDGTRALRILHTGLPRIGSAGTPPGTWLHCLLEGLYTEWMGAQPGSEPSLYARLQQDTTSDRVVLTYAAS